MDIRKEAASEEGFRNPKHRLSYEDKRKRSDKADDVEAEIKSLQDRVSHLEAQLEFLKKIEKIRNNY